MKSWIEENPVTYRKQMISKEIRQLKRSLDPSRDLKIATLEAEYQILHAPMAEKKKAQLKEFLKKFQK